MDIDTLRSVAEASKIKPDEDSRDVEERREARWAAVEARRVHAYAMNLEAKRQRIEEEKRHRKGSKETLSDWQWALLEGLHDDSLRTTANRLTFRSGHGTIRDRDGMRAMLGQNTHSNTRRVLDSFQPLRMEELDLAQYV